jgi:hypothetical protein
MNRSTLQKFISVTSLVSIVVPAACGKQIADSSSASTLASLPAAAAPGFIVDSANGPRTDAIVMERLVYTGSCPGTVIKHARGYFFDPEMATAPSRRVKIVNVTSGMDSDSNPYTDRQYQSGGRSEKIDFFPMSQHAQRYFSVAEGSNEFKVTYSDGDRVVGTKHFKFPVVVTTRYQSRSAICHSGPVIGPVNCYCLAP